MQLFNGTPLPIQAKAEGITYIIGPGEIVEVTDAHGMTIHTNFAPRGLRVIRVGDDQDALREEGTAALCEHIKTNIHEFNQMQLDLSRQGLKLLPPNRQLDELALVLRRIDPEAEADLKVVTETEIGKDPTEVVIRTLAQSVKKLGDSPEADKLAEVLKDLIAAKGTKTQAVEEKRNEILGAADFQGAPGQARARQHLKSRQAGKKAETKE